MKLPEPRGPIREGVSRALSTGSALPDDGAVEDGDVLGDDLQLALWMSYHLHYAGFDDVDPEAEWDPGLLALRRLIERPFEEWLRETTQERIAEAREAADEVPDQLFAMAKDTGGPSLASFLVREASREQYAEFLVHRSLKQLKESDAAAWVLPRLHGGAKAVLAELLYDEFGDGRPERVHSRLYAETMDAAGLASELGGYVDAVPAEMLLVDNTDTFFGLHRRLRGAALGHLAVFESTSPLSCRKYVGAAERLEYPPAVAAYWEEHVEADAIHDQLAVRGICGTLTDEEPELADDVLFGAAACLEVEGRWGSKVLEAFEDRRSSLRSRVPEEAR